MNTKHQSIKAKIKKNSLEMILRITLVKEQTKNSDSVFQKIPSKIGKLQSLEREFYLQIFPL